MKRGCCRLCPLRVAVEVHVAAARAAAQARGERHAQGLIAHEKIEDRGEVPAGSAPPAHLPAFRAKLRGRVPSGTKSPARAPRPARNDSRPSP